MLQWAWGCRYLFKILISVPLDKYAEVELLDFMAVLFLVFLGTYTFCSILYHSAFPPRVHKSSNFSIFSPTLVISFHFDNSHPTRYEVVSHWF